MFAGAAAGDRLPRRIEVDETWLLASVDERARSDEAVDMVSGEADEGVSSECKPFLPQTGPDCQPARGTPGEVAAESATPLRLRELRIRMRRLAGDIIVILQSAYYPNIQYELILPSMGSRR